MTVVLNSTVGPCVEAASSHCTGSEKFTFSESRDSPEKAWHWRKRRCGFFAHGNRRARLHDMWAWAPKLDR
jgi:hypothetical protein